MLSVPGIDDATRACASALVKVDIVDLQAKPAEGWRRYEILSVMQLLRGTQASSRKPYVRVWAERGGKLLGEVRPPPFSVLWRSLSFQAADWPARESHHPSWQVTQTCPEDCSDASRVKSVAKFPEAFAEVLWPFSWLPDSPSLGHRTLALEFPPPNIP